MQKKNTGIHTVYIGNLSYNRDEDGVLGLFKKYGYIKNIKLMREGKQNKSKGVAFVDMVNMQDAQKAINDLDGSEVDGRTLKVSLAKTQNFKAAEKEAKPKTALPSSRELKLEKKERRLNKKEGLQALFASKR